MVSFVLDHGEDPLDGLAAVAGRAGWSAVEGTLGALTLHYDVARRGPRPRVAARRGRACPPTTGRASCRASGSRRTRWSSTPARLLLTQLSHPRPACRGGGPCPAAGSTPVRPRVAAVVREVREETGQEVDDVRFVGVMTQHWVGRSERGAEDYHAVRLVHTARCPRSDGPRRPRRGRLDVRRPVGAARRARRPARRAHRPVGAACRGRDAPTRRLSPERGWRAGRAGRRAPRAGHRRRSSTGRGRSTAR